MDTITHTLFGLALNGAADRRKLTRSEKRAVLFTAVVGSQIPDIDVVSQLWDTQGMYQMWHRGITHSVFMIPVWALLIWLACRLFWKVKDPKLLGLGALAVFIHDTSDVLNAWGTGYLEPFSDARLTLGVIPIVDLVFWAVILTGYLLVRFGRKASHRVFRGVWAAMTLHVAIQCAFGYGVYQSVKGEYDQVALAADFVPWTFQAFGKKEGTVDILEAKPFREPAVTETLVSQEQADLEPLFARNPAARTLMEWSPFVVIVDDGQRLGVYDPRFYRNGESFLFEYLEKK